MSGGLSSLIRILSPLRLYYKVIFLTWKNLIIAIIKSKHLQTLLNNCKDDDF